MESVGNEKRIRALFSELSIEDQSRAPQFDKLWRGAENTKPAPVRKFRHPAIAFAALVIVAACVLAVWSWSDKTPGFNAVNIHPQIPQITSPTPLPTVAESNSTSSRQIKRSHAPRKKRLQKYQAPESTFTEAAMVWNWQSPTSILMKSPATLVWNSLPKLNQSAEELKQFLPKDHEVTKESNQ